MKPLGRRGLFRARMVCSVFRFLVKVRLSGDVLQAVELFPSIRCRGTPSKRTTTSQVHHTVHTYKKLSRWCVGFLLLHGNARTWGFSSLVGRPSKRHLIPRRDSRARVTVTSGIAKHGAVCSRSIPERPMSSRRLNRLGSDPPSS